MTALASSAFADCSKVSPSHPETRNGTQGMSSRKFSTKSEVLTYRQHFAKMWQHFITANFDDPAHAAYFFKVDPSTAENWFEGLNAPQGWVIGRALSDPTLRDAALCCMGAAE